MRKSKAETAQSRQQILEQAGRLFRERGPERVSVADVMAAAGMTHGGFYKHFPSKDALFAAAIDAAFADRFNHLTQLSAPDAASGVRSYLNEYLTLGHVKSVGRGCPIAGLAADTARMESDARTAMSVGASSLLDRLTTALADEDAAIRVLISAIGAVVLARAVEDEALQRRILEIASQDSRTSLDAAT